jgi:SAM-dependent methyltransferase
MTPLPSVDISFSPLHHIVTGPLKAALLNCALDLSLFDSLRRPETAKTVATALNLHPGNTSRLMDALVTLDLLEKNKGYYKNSHLAQTFLVTTSPACIGPLLKQTQNPALNPLDALAGLVTQGPPANDTVPDMADEILWAEEVTSSAGWVFGGTGSLVADAVQTLDGFSSFTRFLDMGCGHGAFSLYILERHPDLHAVLMDRTPVLDAAMPLMERFEAQERVSRLDRDYITDDLGSGYDLIFASATLNFARGCLPDLVRKIHGSLLPGGYFISFQDGMTHERTRPDTMLGAVIPAMMMDNDYCFNQGEIARTALDCGFRWVRSSTVSTPIGPMDLDISLK